MVRFELNHTCNLADARGVAGDIIDVSEGRAEYLLARKGGQIVAGPRDDEAEASRATAARPTPRGTQNRGGRAAPVER